MLEDIEIGRTDSDEIVTLDAEARKRNILMIGPPGTGKTKALEDQVRQHIMHGEGLFLLDPDGAIYDPIVEWCAQERLHERRSIHLIDFREEDWCVGFDGFRMGPSAAGLSAERFDALRVARVDAMVAGVAQVFAGENSYETPRLRQRLRSVFYALAVNELTLAEVTTLTTATDVYGVREVLTADLPNQTFRDMWRDLNALSRHVFAEQFESSMNRLVEFIGHPLIKRMLAQRKRVIDFRQAMDRGEIILCRAAVGDDTAMSPDDARLVGTLLVGDLVVAGLGRPEQSGPDQPFNVIIDEAPQYLNSDIKLALDRLRKRGVYFTFAIQRLGQLIEAGKDIYNAVMADVQNKMVFRTEEEDAQLLALMLFRPEFDLRQVKLTAPATVGHYIDTLTSRTEQESRSGAHSHTDASDSEAETQLYDKDGEEAGSSRSQQHNPGTDTYTETWARSASETQHEVLRPDIHWITTQYKDLVEVTHDHIVILRKLPDRHAIVKTMDRPTVRIQTLDVEPAYASPRRLAEFSQQVFEKSAYTSPLTAIEQEIAERHARLVRLAGRSSAGGSSDEPGPPPFEAKWS